MRRRGEEKLPKKAFSLSPTGRKKRSKPEDTWFHEVLDDVKERNIPENLCKDRNEWRLRIRKM